MSAAVCPKCNANVGYEATSCEACGQSWFASQCTIDVVAHLHDSDSADVAPPAPAFVDELVRRWADAEFADREAEARAAVVAKVRDAVEATLASDRTSYYANDEMVDGDYQAIADAAVGVFVDMLRNPPAHVTHADGHTEIRWPDEGDTNG